MNKYKVINTVETTGRVYEHYEIFAHSEKEAKEKARKGKKDGLIHVSEEECVNSEIVEQSTEIIQEENDE